MQLGGRKMETKKFERKSGKYVGMIAFVLVLISVLSLIFSIVSTDKSLCNVSIVALEIAIISMIAAVVVAIIILFMPDDFEYVIKQNGDVILFEFGLDDVRVLKKNFHIFSQKKRYLILEDGNSRIKIAYNSAVLKFLKELGA